MSPYSCHNKIQHKIKQIFLSSSYIFNSLNSQF